MSLEHKTPRIYPPEGVAKHLEKSRWWEGPAWLRTPAVTWAKPCCEFNEAEIFMERKKVVHASFSAILGDDDGKNVNLGKFSNYLQIIRMVAWIIRFVNNCRPSRDRKCGELTVDEIENAEKQVVTWIQKESFSNDGEKAISTLPTFRDKDGIIRVTTKITLKPMVLPSTHPIVKFLIMDRHKRLGHAGVHILLNNLREDFWISKGRKTSRSVLKSCAICQRYQSQNIETFPAPLPHDRLRETLVFEVVGVDYAGPLFLRGGNKAWICLFTCSVYRAVHLELATSLSTETFLQCFRRFIARRGRPSTIYSDKSTNFVGSKNLLANVDWEKIQDFATIQRINWKLNPPSAAWWGGWWERLIRLLKDLLKRILGRACLSYEEMNTILCDCEAVVNSRPITYLYSEPNICPLTPAMFLHEIKVIGTPDLDQLDSEALNKRLRYRQTLRAHFRERFRVEYLGQLIQPFKSTRNLKSVKVGEVVLIGSDNEKRVDWPMAKIIKLLPRKDGAVRVVKLKTSRGELIRPVQRIFPLEVTEEERGIITPKRTEKEGKVLTPVEPKEASPPVTTRSGRTVKKPQKYEH